MQNCRNLDEYLTVVVDSFKLEDFKPGDSTQAAYQAKIAYRFKEVFRTNDVYWYLDEQPERNNFLLCMRAYPKSNDIVAVSFEIVDEAIKFLINKGSNFHSIPEYKTIDFRSIWINLDELRVGLKETLKKALVEANPWMKDKKSVHDTLRVVTQ